MDDIDTMTLDELRQERSNIIGSEVAKPPPADTDIDSMSLEQLKLARDAEQGRLEQSMAPVRQWAAERHPEESGAKWALRKFVSPLRGPITQAIYGSSRKALDEGRADETDLQNIAIYEQEQGRDSSESLGTALGGAALSLPGQAALLFGGGAAAKAITPVAAAGPGLLPAAGRLAIQAGVTPNLGPAAAIAANVEHGREWNDARGIVTGLLKTTAELGVIGGVTKGVKAVAPAAGKIGEVAVAGASGPFVQSAADITTYGLGLNTRYGSVQDLVEGKHGDAAKHALIDIITYGSLGAMHGDPAAGRKIVDQAKETLDAAARRGAPVGAAVEAAHVKAAESAAKIQPKPQKEGQEADLALNRPGEAQPPVDPMATEGRDVPRAGQPGREGPPEQPSTGERQLTDQSARMQAAALEAFVRGERRRLTEQGLKPRVIDQRLRAKDQQLDALRQKAVEEEQALARAGVPADVLDEAMARPVDQGFAESGGMGGEGVPEAPGSIRGATAADAIMADRSQPEARPSGPDLFAQELTKPVDRRQDLARRARVAEMPPEELRRELLTSEKTGLLNRRAYDEAERQPYQAAIDVDGLKPFNTRFGHEGGDQLIRAVGEAFRAEKVPAFHFSGDEFAHEGADSAKVRADLDRVQKRLSEVVLTFRDSKGRVYTKKGIDLSFDVAEFKGDIEATLKTAEKGVEGVKAQREREGTRELRKDWEARYKADPEAVPRGVSEVPTPGREVGQRQAAEAEVTPATPVSEIRATLDRELTSLSKAQMIERAKSLGYTASSRKEAEGLIRDHYERQSISHTRGQVIRGEQPGQEVIPITAATRPGILDRIERGEGNLTEIEKAIATARVMDLIPYADLAKKHGLKHRQNAANIEKDALKKLGYSGTAAQLHGQTTRPVGQKMGPEFALREPKEENAQEFNPDSGPPLVGSMPSAEQRTVGGISGQPETTSGSPKLTALANAKIAEERAERGLHPVLKSYSLSHPEAVAKAEAMLRENINAGAELMDSMEANPRPISTPETFLLLHHRVHLKGELQRAIGRKVIMSRTPEDAAIHQQKINDVIRNLDRWEKVSEGVGGEAGGAFNARKQLMSEDYELAGMLQRAYAAKGEPLTEAEHAKIGELAAKIADLEAKLAEAEKVATSKDDRDLQDARIATKRPKRDFKDLIETLKVGSMSPRQKVFRGGLEVLDAARALMTSGDLSAIGRQGGFYLLAHPIKTITAAKESLRSMFSERFADRAFDRIQQESNYAFAKSSGLKINDPTETKTLQGEAFVGRLLSKPPTKADWRDVRKLPLNVARAVVTGSNRAFNAGLNRIRMDAFNSMVGAYGENGRVSKAEGQALADFVNTASGHGDLGKFEPAAAALSRIYFAPHFVASRFRLLAGTPLYKGTKQTRKLMAKEYARFLLGAGTVFSLAAVAGADIDWDFRGADFGKIKIGNTRIDPLAGLAQTTRLVARVGNTAAYTLSDKKIGKKDEDLDDVLFRFNRTKLAPVPGAVYDAIKGKDVVGQKATPTSAALGLVTPIVAEDVQDAFKEFGVPKGVGLSLLSLMGWGVQTYEPRQKSRSR